MKTILLLFGLFFSTVSMAQSFNDTLFYNSGEHRVVNVLQVSNSTITYQYKKKNGRVHSGKTRKSMLGGYAIYNSSNTLLNRKEQTPVERDEKASRNKRQR